MSVLASLDICVTNIASVFDMITICHEIGWSWKDREGESEFLPLNDSDSFNWYFKTITEEELAGLINTKEKAGETIGVQLYYRSGEIGVSLLAENRSQYSFLLNCNRVKCAETRGIGYTDVNWYMEKIVQALQKKQVQIESVRYSEI